ncbi:MAG: hypothetical protein QXQ66_08880 [Candidatus Hadarchaeum sp.]|uniref:hypothetical protein n=1 Tax=Candidatus Hadarchaeum sp. TaxID=2883567 RepID=UPI0031807DC6
MKEMLTESISFPFKGPLNLRLGYYFPLYNGAITHRFKKETKYNKLVYAHEMYSHPVCSQHTIGPKALIFFYAHKILSYPNYAPLIAKHFEPILEGAVLADLFFIERELYEEMLATTDIVAINVAQKFIEVLQCALRWREKPVEEYDILHPFGRIFVQYVCNFIDCDEPFKKKAKCEFIPFSFPIVSNWLGFDVLDILHRHLQDPQKNCIPQWVEDFTIAKLTNKIKEWLLALLLAGSLIYQHIDEKCSLVGVAFCSRQLLGELRVFEIAPSPDGLVFAPRFSTPLLLEPDIAYTDVFTAIERSIRKTYRRYSDPNIPLPIVYPHYKDDDLRTVPTNLFSDNNLPFFQSSLSSLAQNIYFRIGKSCQNLNPHTIAECAKKAIIAVHDAIAESFSIWKRDKTDEGIGQIFNYIELGTRTTGTISSIDESVYYLLSGWFYLARVSKIFNAAWEFLNQYSSRAFSQALDNAFEKSQYYCFNGHTWFQEKLRDCANKNIVKPNSVALALMPKQKREEFLAALAPVSL